MAKKRYVVIIDSNTKEQDEVFRKFIEHNGIGWWHWLSNSWLLVDTYGKLSTSIIREELRKTHPNVYSFVLELNEAGDTWSGFGPKTNEKNMFQWVHKNWIK